MSRRHFTFACEGAALAATIDEGAGPVGLLIVSGGNEVRSGPAASHARLAARIAGAGYPVMRFDRRGVGDSEGANPGFAGSGPDIAAAIAAFKAGMPGLERVVALGNCDAASALMLAGGEGCAALILTNPWTFDAEPRPYSPEQVAGLPPRAVRAHYLRRLVNRGALRRLLSGRVALLRAARNLTLALRPAPPPSRLARDLAAGLARFGGPVRILLAARDRTAQAFLAGWPRKDSRLAIYPGASHGFVESAASEWLAGAVIEALRAA